MHVSSRHYFRSSFKIKVFFFVLFAIGLVVVDCSASSETVEILMKAVDLGCCVVLANKKPLTSTLVASLLLIY